MFKRYAPTILAILIARGTFDTTPETLVSAVLETLSGLVEADHDVVSDVVANVPTVADLELILDRGELTTWRSLREVRANVKVVVKSEEEAN